MTDVPRRVVKMIRGMPWLFIRDERTRTSFKRNEGGGSSIKFVEGMETISKISIISSLEFHMIRRLLIGLKQLKYLFIYFSIQDIIKLWNSLPQDTAAFCSINWLKKV